MTIFNRRIKLPGQALSRWRRQKGFLPASEHTTQPFPSPKPQKNRWARLALLLAGLFAGNASATLIGFDSNSNRGVNDCATAATNGCFIVTPSSTPPVPNPVTRNPNNGQLLVWDEVQNFVLESDLRTDRVADPDTPFVTPVGDDFLIEAGTVVSSHYAQWDPGNGSQSRVDTALLFDSNIFAFITADQNLFDSDFLGLPGIDYNDFGLRGLEAGDTTAFGTDLSRVDISWAASSPGDWTRIITAFSPGGGPLPIPEPGTLSLLILGLAGIGWILQRTWPRKGRRYRRYRNRS